MGRIARLLSFVRGARHGAKLSDVKSDPGGGPNVTSEHFSAPGDDSFPLPGDWLALSDQEGTGRESVVGYIDPKNLQKSTVGDKRIYSRDSSGDQAAEVWLKNDGTVIADNGDVALTLEPDGSAILQNGAGSIVLQADGEVNINGARITVAGEFVSATGKVLSTHTHAQGNDSDGSVEVETNAPS